MSASLDPQTRCLFPCCFQVWQERGLSARAASSAALAGCDAADEIPRLGRSYFENQPNLRSKSLAQLADLAGWPPKRRTVVDTIAAALALGMDPQEARETATDILAPLGKAGFVLAVSNRARA